MERGKTCIGQIIRHDGARHAGNTTDTGGPDMTKTYTSKHTSYDLARMAGCADPDTPDAWCDRHGGPWGDDETCEGCTTEDGHPRPYSGDPSPGAEWLRRVEDDAREAWEWERDNGQDDRYGARTSVEHLDAHGVIHEVADGVVPVSPYGLWQVFADLGAWDEDVRDHYVDGPEGVDGPKGPDMTDAAGFALYRIADRLVRALVEEWADEATD